MELTDNGNLRRLLAEFASNHQWSARFRTRVNAFLAKLSGLEAPRECDADKRWLGMTFRDIDGGEEVAVSLDDEGGVYARSLRAVEHEGEEAVLRELRRWGGMPEPKEAADATGQ